MKKIKLLLKVSILLILGLNSVLWVSGYGIFLYKYEKLLPVKMQNGMGANPGIVCRYWSGFWVIEVAHVTRKSEDVLYCKKWGKIG